MKFLYILIVLLLSASYGNAFSDSTASAGPLTSEADVLSKKCNLEARNSLINGDIPLVEKVCMDAIKELEKSDSNKEYLINSMLNLSFAYSLSGHYDKAAPLYRKARDIGEKLYKPDSKELKEIDTFIEEQEKIKQQSIRQ